MMPYRKSLVPERKQKGLAEALSQEKQQKQRSKTEQHPCRVLFLGIPKLIIVLTGNPSPIRQPDELIVSTNRFVGAKANPALSYPSRGGALKKPYKRQGFGC
jgi:hypothetical protein